MVNMTQFDPETDNDRHRVMAYGKNEIKLKAEDPYGFVKISFRHGTVPEEMSGYYTSMTEALKAVNLYITQKDIEAEKQKEKESLAAQKLHLKAEVVESVEKAEPTEETEKVKDNGST